MTSGMDGEVSRRACHVYNLTRNGPAKPICIYTGACTHTHTANVAQSQPLVNLGGEASGFICSFIFSVDLFGKFSK